MVTSEIAWVKRVVNKPRILVIDDESRWLNLLRVGLENKGFEVITLQANSPAFNNTSQLKEIVQNHMPDVIVTDYDYNFRTCTGIDLRDTVKSFCPEMPIFLHSGTKSVLEISTKYGFEGGIKKSDTSVGDIVTALQTIGVTPKGQKER